jgi:hypothetical protein
MAAHQVQRPGQQRRAGIVPGNEQGQHLVPDQLILHPACDQFTQQVFSAVGMGPPFPDQPV